MKMMKSKKGIESTTLMMYASIIFILATVIIGMVSLLTQQFKSSIVPVNLESEVYESMLLYSPNCFAYEDPITKRVYSGTIDLKKFNELTLRNCIPNARNSEGALKVELIGAVTKLNFETRNYAQKTTTILKKKSSVVQIRDEGPGLMIFYYKQ